ncbi:rhamnogalacturonan acetylesterase [Massilia sp. G4R7]|uniref:Rhamnogalacturonan acetylesterase n=1 Tax=Massilia phyllostachyos TaxID=2898585 RepID=A0ABS8PZR0_9BURK|nr:rhamnogalacturonan acetylesterase [Massilia phyllostachyos]MCD2514973.1 rhamnogalacturonan acetylesterase [Massilia phyllostachyos]
MLRPALALFPLLLAAHVHATPALPDRIILVGDSTMASTTGYGDALCARFTPETACLNLARGGRSSGSFRAEGRWDEVTRLLQDGAAFRKTYVLIQFGHNDQPGKPGRSTDFVTEFPANMKRYVEEARALGAEPVLVTPLTRRSFKGGYVHNDLAPWAGAIRDIARATRAPLVDLNALSLSAVQAMGPKEADKLARLGANFDYTHLGPAGAERFAGIMASELPRKVPALAADLRGAR